MTGANLHTLRLAKCWTQEELAFKAGCSRSYVSQMEAGLRVGSRATLRKLANALDCAASELLDEEPTDVVPKSRKSAGKPKAATTAKSSTPRQGRIAFEFQVLQDRRRQLVADLGIVDAKLEVLLRVI
jgi:transcriptional regulator with XRE-family HTH domain